MICHEIDPDLIPDIVFVGRGCPAAALRLWTAPDTEHAPTELCGDKPSNEPWHYISQGQSARISFITTDKTIGAQVIQRIKLILLTNTRKKHCLH